MIDVTIGGYIGKILEIDLSAESTKVIDLDLELARAFIGGKGLGAKILYDRVDAGIDPFEPANVLIFATGPLTGTLAPTSGRSVVVTKSPLTGIFLDSHVGGYWGVEMKRAGYDAIVVFGKCQNSTYLEIGDEVRFHDADSIWGKDTIETVRDLRSKHGGRKLRVACIGPAGERLVRFATINIDTHEQRERGGQAGRGGAGAVMGSKNLKAVLLTGGKRPMHEVISYANKSGFRAAVKKCLKKLISLPIIHQRRRYGTPLWVGPMNELGILPTRNFSETTFEHADNITGETMREKIVIGDKSCYNCPIRCGKQSAVNSGRYKGTELEGPEYEVLVLLGSNCGIGSLEAIARASELVDRFGLDGISTGGVIGFAMACRSAGGDLAETLTKLDADFSELKFGNEQALLATIEKIAYREGLGDILADGVRLASKKIGHGSERFATHVKGMELPAYDPRGAYGMGLAYATSDRGACHMRAWTILAETRGELGERFSVKGRAKLVKQLQDDRAIRFSSVLCSFAALDVSDYLELLNFATGFELSEEDYFCIGERIWNLTRLFNVREGISRKDDCLPPQMMAPVPAGPAKGSAITTEMLDEMLDEYYELRGWDRNGIPTRKKLISLGLV